MTDLDSDSAYYNRLICEAVEVARFANTRAAKLLAFVQSVANGEASMETLVADAKRVAKECECPYIQ
jgi:hypothetical protein